jgi:hypothetical protein
MGDKKSSSVAELANASVFHPREPSSISFLVKTPFLKLIFR